MSIALQAKQPNFLDFLINLLHRYLKIHTLTINAEILTAKNCLFYDEIQYCELKSSCADFFFKCEHPVFVSNTVSMIEWF